MILLILLTYYFFPAKQAIVPISAETTYTVLMIGAVGAGKSTLSNIMARDDLFFTNTSNDDMGSVTKEAVIKNGSFITP
jgi:ABC-type enterochelin transport system ATPase subunit